MWRRVSLECTGRNVYHKHINVFLLLPYFWLQLRTQRFNLTSIKSLTFLCITTHVRTEKKAVGVSELKLVIVSYYETGTQPEKEAGAKIK